ncbi:MAG: hypothetical protein ACOZDY_08870 [Pseudomonadota bacterium]
MTRPTVIDLVAAATRPEPPDPPATRPTIDWIEGELPQIVDAAEAALIAGGESIYQRAGQLVRVVRREAHTARTFRRAAGALGLVPVDTASLVETLTRLADWRRWDRRSDAWRPANCPDRVAQTYLSRVGLWRVRPLWAAVDAPTLRPDGSLLQRPGYDDATGILYAPSVTYPGIPDRPTRAQAEAALEQLQEVVADMPFVDRVDRAVAVAMMMTGVIRRSLPAAPLGAITAPVMAAGKTLLADAIAIVATGVSASAMAHPATEEEAAKLVLALLAEGEAVVLLDNIERPLDGAWLCAVLTSESFAARRLGSNTLAHVPTSTLWLATGNALLLRGDLRTRALLCRLDPRCERPEQREFAGDLRVEVARRRPELVAAALTVMRAFLAAGERPSAHVRPWGRFESWSDRVRAPLVWLGEADPCASIAQLEAEDPDRARHVAILRAWHDAFAGERVTVRDVIDRGVHDPALREALELVARDRSGQLDALRLGRWLRQVQGRIVAGAEFQRDGARQGVALWSVRGTPHEG